MEITTKLERKESKQITEKQKEDRARNYQRRRRRRRRKKKIGDMGSENIPVRLPRSPVGGETLSESRGKRLISFFIFCTNQTALSQIPNTWSL